MQLRVLSPLLASLALGSGALGCGGGIVEPDAAILDGGPAIDTGSIEDDTGEGDAGASARPVLAVPCEALPDAVYEAIPEGSVDPMAGRGLIRACAYERFLSATEIETRLGAVEITDVPATHGAHVIRIAFQTTRDDGTAAISSARVLLPEGYARMPSPMLVAAHGTAGLADLCAPSRYETVSDGLTLPWATSGWPVIAPDYAGLGTAGLQGYGDNDDTARSQLDAARALRALLPTGALTDEIVMVGHSQGGGVVLSAQALASTYGAGGDLLLVLPFAPGWQIDRDVTGYRFPMLPTSFGGGVPASIASLFLYAWHGNTLGIERAGEGFGAGARAGVTSAIESVCIFALAEPILAAAPTYGDLVDETFRTGLLSCADGGTCTGNAQAFWEFLGTNILHGDPSGARVVIHTGTADTTVTPASAACVVDHLAADGVTATVCVDGSTHGNVVPRGASSALAQAEAALMGAPPPACPTTTTLPACR